MPKSKIIIADLNEMYLSSLEIKFLAELSDVVEMEVITEQEYFSSYFKTPKSLDVLLVSEDLYFSELKNQNISNIYVLTENDGEGDTQDLGISTIYKYTNPNEIYNQVVATSGIGASDIKNSKETIVVMIYSAAGGVGNTTLALALSHCLSKSFKKVLYINAQRMNSFQVFLNNDSPIPASVYSELSNHDGNVYSRIKHIIRTEVFDYLPPFSSSLANLNIDYSIYEGVVRSAKSTKDYDVIVVDTDSVFDSAKASMITMSDKVIIVTTQGIMSVYTTNMLIKNMNVSEKDKFIYLCNKFNPEQFNALKQSKDIKPAFTVNEYVKFMADIDELSLDDISHDPDIRKIPFLLF